MARYGQGSLDDDWETSFFTDLSAGPDDDADGDGLTNLQEFRLGTDPLVYAIELRLGWNLISLANVPLDNSVLTLLGDAIIGDVWIWVDDHYEQVDELLPLRGHWCYALADATIAILLP